MLGCMQINSEREFTEEKRDLTHRHRHMHTA